MKCDNIMEERLFDTRRRYDSLHLEEKRKKLKQCLTLLSHHETHESVMQQIITTTQKV